MHYQSFTLSILLLLMLMLTWVMGQMREDDINFSVLSKYGIQDHSHTHRSAFSSRLLAEDEEDEEKEMDEPTWDEITREFRSPDSTSNKPPTECDTLRDSEIGNELSDTKSTNKFLRCLLLAMEASNLKNIKLSGKIKNDGDIYLPDNYNKYEVPILNVTLTAPNGTEIKLEEATEARVFLTIRGVRELDEVKGEMTLDMELVVIWVDGQILKNVKKLTDKPFEGFINLNPVFLKKIWTPDIYFEEAVSISNPSFMGKSETIVLLPAIGSFTYRTRIIAKLNCPMNFAYYPSDTQECTFKLKSFSYTTKLLTIDWVKSKALKAGGGVYLLETSDPNFDFQVASYYAEDLPLDLGPHTSKDTLYSTLKFTILGRRKLSYHVVQTYIPSSFFVIVTWLCFIIPSDMFEARVGISMTTLLTLTAMFASVRETSPSVSYVKAIDIWMVLCIIFLFGALFAFTASEWVKRVLRKLNQVQTIQTEENGAGLESEVKTTEVRHVNGKRLWIYEKADGFIEKYLAWLLSSGFILFIIIYWSWLLFQSGYTHWEINSTLNRVN